MSSIIVIGNGFDLNLGFETSYEHFMNSKYFRDLHIKEKNSIARDLFAKKNIKNWIDVEEELANYSKLCIDNYGYTKGMIEKVHKEYKALSNALVNYLQSLNFTNYTKNSYACDFIREISGECTIIDFNYTTTLKSLINEIGIRYTTNILKIHGTIEGGNRIVFGVSDKAPIHPDHTFLKKGCSPHLSCWNSHKILSNANNISFFGYSFGYMDHTYFKDLFMKLCAPSKTLKNIRIHYYGNDSYDQITKNLDVLTDQNLTLLRQNHLVKFIDVK